VSDSQAVVDLAEGVEAVLPVREASVEKVDDLTKILNPGDEIEVMITNVDRKNRTINVSVKAKDAREEQEAIKKVKEADKSAGTTSLGDILQDKFSQ
jgi:small subunit ribosomal protein S1